MMNVRVATLAMGVLVAPSCIVFPGDQMSSQDSGSGDAGPPPVEASTVDVVSEPAPRIDGVGLATGEQPPRVTVDDTGIYWTTYDGMVMRLSKGGGAPTTLASGQHLPYDIAVDANSVYWTNFSDGTVVKVPLSG